MPDGLLCSCICARLGRFAWFEPPPQASGGLAWLGMENAENAGASAWLEGVDELPPTESMQARIVGESPIETEPSAGSWQLVAPFLAAIESKNDLAVAYRSGAVNLGQQHTLAGVGGCRCDCATSSAGLPGERTDQQQRQRDSPGDVIPHESFISSSF